MEGGGGLQAALGARPTSGGTRFFFLQGDLAAVLREIGGTFAFFFFFFEATK